MKRDFVPSPQSIKAVPIPHHHCPTHKFFLSHAYKTLSRIASIQMWWYIYRKRHSPSAIERSLFVETDTTSHDKGMIAEDLLAILCCPETKQDIRLLEPKLVEQLNQRIEKGELKTKGGQPVTEKIDGGLLRNDETVVYPIRDQIPIMLIEEGILVEKSDFS
jgi:uncharacterized protein YbaR (Trm112 family)